MRIIGFNQTQMPGLKYWEQEIERLREKENESFRRVGRDNNVPPPSHYLSDEMEECILYAKYKHDRDEKLPHK
jgi:hypothetical protein